MGVNCRWEVQLDIRNGFLTVGIVKDLNRLLEEAVKDSKNRLDKHLLGIVLVYMFADCSKEWIAQSPFQSCFPVIL